MSHRVLEQRAYFVRMSGDVQLPAWKRRKQRYVTRRVVSVTAGRPIVTCTDRHQNCADALVPRVDFELLEHPFHEKRGVGMRKRPVSLKREARRHAD